MSIDPGVSGAIQYTGQAAGLTQEQINVAIAVATAEGGGIGDNGTSFGPFQFHIGGQLDSFFHWLTGQGFNIPDILAAGTAALQSPNLAIKYALEPGGYLNLSLKQGAASGYSGANLAAFVQQFGQRSDPSTWQRTADIYTQLFGGSPITVPLPKLPPPPKIIDPAPKGPITLPGLPNPSDITAPFAGIAAALTQGVSALTGGINDAQALGAFLGQPNLILRLALFGIGVLVILVGLVLFGVSFLPKGIAGDVAKVAA